MNPFIKFSVLLFLCFHAASAQNVLKKTFELSDENSGQSSYSAKPLANTVTVIEIFGDTVYTANSAGLSITTDQGASWYNLTTKDGFYKGSITAMAYHQPYLFLSTLYDTNLSIKPTYGPGGGISYTADFGRTWKHIAQPMDSIKTFDTLRREDGTWYIEYYDYVFRTNGDTLKTLAVRTNIDNVTWDIAVTDTTVWIASFAGGLRHATRLPDGNIGPFFVATIPPDNMFAVHSDSTYKFIIHMLKNLNHRVFSVIATPFGIFSGTAGGLNFTTDGGMSWKRYTAQNSGLSGNFVVALGEQIFTENAVTKHYIWAAANRAVTGTEYNGLCFSPDSGKTWRVALQGPFINNLAFDGKTVFAATDEGLFRSDDLGQNWTQYINIIDATTKDRFFSTSFYTAGVQNPGVNSVLYFANQDGLAISTTQGNTWKIIRVNPEPGKQGQPQSYAYPNPFSPSVDPNVTRFRYDMTGLNPATDKATLKIYDFAMDLVAVVAKNKPVGEVLYWNGLNAQGKRVANGTYIYTIEAGRKKFHGKVTVRN